jgi:hypothetical protein
MHRGNSFVHVFSHGFPIEPRSRLMSVYNELGRMNADLMPLMTYVQSPLESDHDGERGKPPRGDMTRAQAKQCKSP